MPPSAQHEALHRIFQHDTSLFARTLRQVLGINLPDPERVTMLDTDLTEPRPHIRSADSVLLAELLVENTASRYIIIIEAQTDPDEAKWFTWPYYIAHLRDKHQCEAALVVVSSKAETAQWARQPIRCGHRRAARRTHRSRPDWHRRTADLEEPDDQQHLPLRL
jgi:hypothetical protein